MPDDWQERPLRLLFGAIDEQAWVYFNGEPVGEHTVESTGMPWDHLYNMPFEIVVPPETVRYGRENLLSVRVFASRGNAGIWRPVLIGPAPEAE